jgi:hypothetical protein
MAKKKTIFIGVIPGIFGYGISVAGESKEDCMKALKKCYAEWKKGYPNEDTNFKGSFEDWGGRVEEIELGKGYFDDFGS